MTLESERNRLQESATDAERILGSDGQRLFNEAIEYANQFLGAAQACSIEADKWFMADVRLRLQLLNSINATAQQITDGDCKLFEAFDDQARTALRIGLAAYNPNSAVFDELTSLVVNELTALVVGLKSRKPSGRPQIAQIIEIIKQLEAYREDLQILFNLKKEILKGAAGFREKYDRLREIAWEPRLPMQCKNRHVLSRPTRPFNIMFAAGLGVTHRTVAQLPATLFVRQILTSSRNRLKASQRVNTNSTLSRQWLAATIPFSRFNPLVQVRLRFNVSELFYPTMKVTTPIPAT
jgi:hypothetical protein